MRTFAGCVGLRDVLKCVGLKIAGHPPVTKYLAVPYYP
jgi:hypothetical protein